jgi:hypothetical protein
MGDECCGAVDDLPGGPPLVKIIPHAMTILQPTHLELAPRSK